MTEAIYLEVTEKAEAARNATGRRANGKLRWERLRWENLILTCTKS